MAKYRITSPDGATFEINAPDDATPDQVKTYAQQQFQSMKAPPAAGNAAAGGVLGGIKQGLRDSIDGGAQLLRHAVPDAVGNAVDAAGNWMADRGLPVARSSGAAGVDKIVRDSGRQYEADRAAAGREGFDWARLGGNVANPVNFVLPGSAALKTATTVGQLAKAGAMAGAASGALQPVTDAGDNFWAEKAKQTAAGAATGGVLTPVVAKGVTAAATGAKRAMESLAPRVTVNALTRSDMDSAMNYVLQSQGMKLEEAPKVILDSVRRQIGEAVAGGKRLSPEMALRQANAEALGLTGDAALTAGQMSRNPMQFAQERNMSGIVIQTPQGPGNPLATRFANQNQRLMSLFDEANNAVDPVTFGEQGMGALNVANQTADGNVRAAYRAFEQATGRKMELPLQGLAQDYAEALRRYGDNIPQAVRSAFEGLGLMGGTQRRVMSLEDAEDVIKNVINRNDPGPINKPVHGALGELRASIERAITSGADNAASGSGAEAAMLAKEARSTAAGVFQARRDVPALMAALQDKAPDRFLQQFILNAPTREVEGMVGYLKQDPAAFGQARAQLLTHLKRAAFGENLAGDKTIAAERFAAALRAIGPQKLRIFFGEDEAVRLQLAGKVAAEINSVPAGATNAVNYSNTAAGVFNLLQRLGESPLMRNIPGARALSNQAGEIANERAMGQALQGAPAATKAPTELSPEALQAIRRLFLPAAAGGGAAAGGAF
jgi:hypothetical protein